MRIDDTDRNRFLSQLRKLLFREKDPQEIVYDYEVSGIAEEHYRERVKNPINKRTGKPIKKSTLKQYKSQLESSIKTKNEAGILILISEELGLLKNSHRKRKGQGPHRFSRSSAKLRVIHGGGIKQSA